MKGVDITIMIVYFNFYAVARDALHYDPNFSVGRPTNHWCQTRLPIVLVRLPNMIIFFLLFFYCVFIFLFCFWETLYIWQNCKWDSSKFFMQVSIYILLYLEYDCSRRMLFSNLFDGSKGTHYILFNTLLGLL